MRYTEKQIDDIATDISVMRGSQERKDAIKKLIFDLQEDKGKVFYSNTMLSEGLPETKCPKCGKWCKGRSCHKCQQYW